MRLGVAAPRPRSPGARAHAAPPAHPSTAQEASWAPEARDPREGRARGRLWCSEFRGAGPWSPKASSLPSRGRGRPNQHVAVGRKSPASKTSSGRKYWNCARIQRKNTGRARQPGSLGCSGGRGGGRSGGRLAWRDTLFGVPAPCFTAGQCHHGYFQYSAGNNVFCDVLPLAICSWFLPGAKQVWEGRGSANVPRVPGLGRPASGPGGQGLVSTPHLGWHSEAKATHSGISGLPALPGQAVPSVPGPGAGPALPWTSGQTVTSPTPSCPSLLRPVTRSLREH